MAKFIVGILLVVLTILGCGRMSYNHSALRFQNIIDKGKGITLQNFVNADGDKQIYLSVVDLKKGDWKIKVAQARDKWVGALEVLSSTAKRHNAMLAINGDYFSWAPPAQGTQVIDGECFRIHEGRSSFVLDKNGTMKMIKVPGNWPQTPTERHSNCPKNIEQAISGGPHFIKGGVYVWPKPKVNASGLVNIGDEFDFGPEALYWENVLYPQAAIAITDKKELLFVVCDGKGMGGAKGCTMSGDITDILLAHGAIEALKLDSGGSATLYFDGAVVNKPSGKPSAGVFERPIANSLYLCEKNSCL